MSLLFAFWLAVGGIYYGKPTPVKQPLGIQCCLPPAVPEAMTTYMDPNVTTMLPDTTMYTNMSDPTSTPWASPCDIPKPEELKPLVALKILKLLCNRK